MVTNKAYHLSMFEDSIKIKLCKCELTFRSLQLRASGADTFGKELWDNI